MDSFINFLKEKNDLVLTSPQWPLEQQKQLQEITQKHQLREHLWVMSSGTESNRQGRRKIVALSKKAVLAAAEGVCAAFSFNSQDIILNILPPYHVSGAMQMARAYVSGARCIEDWKTSWNPQTFCKNLSVNQVTVTSLVPTQIYDLLQLGLRPPSTLRLVFVGGGALQDSLLKKSIGLGWPLQLTYGMTETCAMIAQRTEGQSGWSRLPHLLEWQSNSDERLQIKGSSLLTGYVLYDSVQSEWIDPKTDGWYTTDDRGLIERDQMTLLGRESEVVKIKGETVSLIEVNQWWQDFCLIQNVSARSLVVPLPHERDGFQLTIVSEESLDFNQIAEFQNKLPAFCKIQKIFQKTLIPRTDLGKIKMSDLVLSLKEN
ncbi:AMP-binding protein [bacterium]|nr:AMP-binding protein [bacterium]